MSEAINRKAPPEGRALEVAPLGLRLSEIDEVVPNLPVIFFHVLAEFLCLFFSDSRNKRGPENVNRMAFSVFNIDRATSMGFEFYAGCGLHFIGISRMCGKGLVHEQDFRINVWLAYWRGCANRDDHIAMTGINIMPTLSVVFYCKHNFLLSSVYCLINYLIGTFSIAEREATQLDF